MFSFGLKDDILTSVPSGLGSWMDFIKGPVESVDQLNEDQLTPACYYSWAETDACSCVCGKKWSSDI